MAVETGKLAKGFRKKLSRAVSETMLERRDDYPLGRVKRVKRWGVSFSISLGIYSCFSAFLSENYSNIYFMFRKTKV